MPAIPADSAASSNSAAAAALASAVARPDAAVDPVTAPAAEIEAAVPVASALSNDPFALSLPDAAAGSAASIAVAAAPAAAVAAAQAAALASLADKDFAGEIARAAAHQPDIDAFHERMGIATAKNYAPRSPAAEALRAENLTRGRANLSDSDTEASTASATAGRGARRSNRSGGRQRDLTRVSEGDTT